MKNIVLLTVLLVVFVFLLMGCASAPPVKVVEVKAAPIERSAPIVPSVDEIQTRPVEWIVVTEGNYQSVLARLRDAGGEMTLFAVTPEGYQNIILNQGDVLKVLRQQKQVIAVYKKSYFDQCC